MAIMLFFITAVTTLGILSNSDRAYSQATQTRVALRLAREGLETLRAGTIKPVAGVQTLTVVPLREGRTPINYTPAIECLQQGSVWLVRSRVTWSEGPRTHVVELKTYVSP